MRALEFIYAWLGRAAFVVGAAALGFVAWIVQTATLDPMRFTTPETTDSVAMGVALFSQVAPPVIIALVLVRLAIAAFDSPAPPSRA